MPFMVGPAPIRRTLKYLEQSRLVLKEQIKIVAIHFNLFGSNHTGTKDFVFWHLPQVQHANPAVQIVTLKNMTPTPFVRCFYETGQEMLIDCDDKSKDEIYEHLIRVIGKSKEVLQAEALSKEKKDNPANFGKGCEKSCICETPGQIPCPAVIPLPEHMRGKFMYKKDY